MAVATYKYLTRSKSEYCWKKCSAERKAALLGNKATMMKPRVS